jgi:hypothetical protein
MALVDSLPEIYLSIGSIIWKLGMMICGCSLEILISIDLLKIEIGQVEISMTPLFLTISLVILDSLSCLSRVEATLGVTCKVFHF